MHKWWKKRGGEGVKKKLNSPIQEGIRNTPSCFMPVTETEINSNTDLTYYLTNYENSPFNSYWSEHYTLHCLLHVDISAIKFYLTFWIHQLKARTHLGMECRDFEVSLGESTHTHNQQNFNTSQGKLVSFVQYICFLFSDNLTHFSYDFT